MGTVTRGAKTGGGTSFNPGQVIVSAEVDSDFDTLYAELNGLLDDTNLETGTLPGAKSLRFTEISDPSSPSANDILLYAKDSSGTTKLYTKDSAGTVTELGAGSGTGAYINLTIESATLPDASGTGNNPPEIVREVSSGSQTTNSPKVTQTFAKFNKDTDEHLLWTVILPANYVSGGTLRLIWKADAGLTSGACYWKGSIAVSTDSSTDDDALIFNTVTGVSSTAPGTQGQPITASITLTTTNMLANRKAVIFIGRDADGTLGTDDLAGDAILCSARFEYT